MAIIPLQVRNLVSYCQITTKFTVLERVQQSSISALFCNGTALLGRAGFTLGFVRIAYTSVQANLMFTTSRTRKVIASLTLVAVPLGCTIYIRQGYRHQHYVVNVTADVLYIAIYVVVPLVVLVVNALLIREICRASNNAAANLGLQQHHHQSQQSAVPTVMLVVTSLVYVLLRGPLSIAVLLYFYVDTSPAFVRRLNVLDVASRLVFAYNFYVYTLSLIHI